MLHKIIIINKEKIMVSSTTIDGITFFDNAKECIAHFENASWSTRTLSFIQSFGTLFLHSFHKIIRPLLRGTTQQMPCATETIDDLAKQKLVVCLHGLNNSPLQYKKIINKALKHNPSETTFFCPKILQQGNAKLDEMAQPIFEQISQWSKTGGEKELVLVGISNGGRIARAIEAKLLEKGNCGNIKKFRFVSVAGACKGSSLADLAHKFHLSWVMKKHISKEMPVSSKRNARLNKDLAQPAPFSRSYTFIAAPHDWEVPNYTSTLMDAPGVQARYAIVPGQGHRSVEIRAAKAVAAIITA
jgi:dienelactone hydrolase